MITFIILLAATMALTGAVFGLITTITGNPYFKILERYFDILLMLGTGILICIGLLTIVKLVIERGLIL